MLDRADCESYRLNTLSELASADEDTRAALIAEYQRRALLRKGGCGIHLVNPAW
jgi:glycine betaine/choline ABC-type transport system substrate-binding protein